MATTETELCNSALRKIGAQRITSLSDDLEEARVCKDLYPIRRDAMLAAHPWKFATKRMQLAADITGPAFGYGYRFVLPLDCLYLLGTDLPDEDWTEEGGYVFTNNALCNVRYVFRQTDVSKYHTTFAEALAWDLAVNIAFPLTQQTALVQSLAASAEKALREARSYNGMRGSVQRVVADSWLDERY